jgi:hypothetical protein
LVQMSISRFEKIQKRLPTERLGIVSAIGPKTSSEDLCLKERLPLIKCECGTEILLLPDLKAMDRAIEAHVAEHKKKGNNPSKAATSSRISQLLVQLSLRKASEYTRH